MRNTLLVRPTRVSVVNPQASYEGAYALYSDSKTSYSVSLVRPGEQLNQAENSLQIRYRSGSPGGLHYIVSQPENLTPRKLQIPFRFLYAFGDADAGVYRMEWWGQSDKGVKEYRGFSVDGAAGEGSGFSCYNWRLFSHNGGLYGLCDKVAIDPEGRSVVVVQLVKYSDDNDKFYVIKRFWDDAVSVPETRYDLQFGSPDAVVIDGVVKIFWRTSNSASDTNSIVGYESSGELDEWTKILDYEIADSLSSSYKSTILNVPFAVQKNFRLRVAYGAGAIMIAYFGVAELVGEETVEFRTFTSYDLGSTLVSNQSQILGFVVTGPDTATVGRGSQSLHPLFVPKLTKSIDLTRYRDVSGRFCLYYDEDMGSFVMMKPGDPSTSLSSVTNAGYLMAIKTSPGSDSDWEPCLQLNLTGPITGLNYGEDKDNFLSDEGLYIYDVDVVPDAGVHTILLSARSYSGTALAADNGVIVGEFKFVDVRQITPGIYRNLFKYGVKTHSDYGFVCSAFDIQQSCLVSPGRRRSQTDKSKFWTELAGCLWRNQVTVFAKPIDDTVNYFTVVGPWSNMGEKVGYQFSYAGKSGSPWGDYFFSKVETGSGLLTYLPTNGLTQCYSTNSADSAYASGIGSLYTNGPWVRDGYDIYPGLKVKATLKVSGVPSGSGWIEVLRFCRKNPDTNVGHEIRIRITGDGNIVVVNHDETEIETLALFLDLDKTWDFVFKVGPTYAGEARFTFWYREHGTRKWRTLGLQPLVPAGVALTPKLWIGYIGASTSTSANVYFGDVFAGTSSRDYNHPYQAVTSGVEPMDKALAQDQGYSDEPFVARHIESYSNSIVLMDGSELFLSGASSDKDYGVNFEYRRSQGRNSSANIVNGMAGSVWDFSNIHDFNDNKTDVVFENLDREDIDSLTLVNMVGISSIVVSGGSYNEATMSWVTNPVQYAYEVPYEELEVAEIDGNMIFLSSLEKYSTSELIGYTVMVHDGSGYTEALVVTDNYDGVIVCTTAVSGSVLDEFRLMTPSTTFDIPSGLGVGKSHFSIRFETALNANAIQIGEVVFGTGIDISTLVDVDGFERDVDSSFSLITSDRGYVHQPMAYIGAIKESVDLKFSGLARLDDSSDRVLRILNELYELDSPFPLVMQKESGEIVTRLSSIASQVAQRSGSYFRDVTVRVDLQNWRVKPMSDFAPSAPVIIRYSVDNSNPIVNTSVNFSVSALEPNDEVLSYDWDFGDGVGSSTDADAAYIYTVAGEYAATITVTNESGESVTRVIRVIAQASEISYYDIVVDDETPAIGTEISISVIARDSNGEIVTDDSETVLTWMVLERHINDVELAYDGADIIVTHENHGIPDGAYVAITASNPVWQPFTPPYNIGQVTYIDADSYSYTPFSFAQGTTGYGFARAELANAVDHPGYGVNYGFDADDDGVYSHLDRENVQQQLVSGSQTQRYVPARSGTFTLAMFDNRGKSAKVTITVS